MYGVTAIVALFHDLLVILGAFVFLGLWFGVEVDIMFVTAALTALAFSVYDTIVIYDRVREGLRRNPNTDFKEVVNLAINGTLVRSLSTSLSILFVLVSMAVLGGKVIFWFVIALIIGTISGSYSSPFLAAPLLTVWHDFIHRKKKARTT
jgi:preprotein translocase subunit SecF